jgi:uncharacterized membrane protein
MEHKQLPVLEVIKYSFLATWQHIGTIIKLFFTCFLVYAASCGVMAIVLLKANVLECFAKISDLYEASSLETQSAEYIINFQDISSCLMPILGWVIFFGCVAILIYTLLSLGSIKIILNLHDRKPAPISLLFTTASLQPAFFATWILYVSMAFIGCILFIIPGIFVAIRFGFFQFFIVDQQCGPIEALKRSYHVTRGYTWQLIKIILCFMLATMSAGFLINAVLLALFSKSIVMYTFFIVLFRVTAQAILYAALAFSYAYIYRQLTDNKHFHRNEY